MKLLGWKGVVALTGGVIVLYYLGKHEATQAVETAAKAVNPTDPDNVFNRGANSVFQAISGDHVDTIGTWLYGVLHDEPAAAAQPENWQHAPAAQGGG